MSRARGESMMRRHFKLVPLTMFKNKIIICFQIQDLS